MKIYQFKNQKRTLFYLLMSEMTRYLGLKYRFEPSAMFFSAYKRQQYLPAAFPIFKDCDVIDLTHTLKLQENMACSDSESEFQLSFSSISSSESDDNEVRK